MPPREKSQSTSKIHVDEGDDDRTQVSKQITWVLRRGAAGVGIHMDDKGWVKVADLATYEKLQGQTPETLLQIIEQSNTKKARYQVSPDRVYVRAFDKEERKTINDQFTDPKAAAAVATMSSTGGYPGYWPQMPYPMMSPYSAAYMSYPFMGMGWQQAASAMPHTGRIKSYNPDKGFGFIECEATQAMYGRDVFVHKAQIGNLTQGAWVTFACELGKNGMPQAKDVQGYGGYTGGKSGKGGKGKDGKGKGKDGKGKGKSGEKGKSKGKGKQDKEKNEKKEETKDAEDNGVEKNSEKEAEKATAEATTEATTEATAEAADAPKA